MVFLIFTWQSILLGFFCVLVGLFFYVMQQPSQSPPPSSPPSTNQSTTKITPIEEKNVVPIMASTPPPPSPTPIEAKSPSSSTPSSTPSTPIKKEVPVTRPNPSTAQNKGNDFMKQFLAKPVDKELERLFEECVKFWQRPLEELSVFKDLGRLAKRTEIYQMEETFRQGEEKEGGEIILGFPTQQDSSRAVVKLIRILGEKLEDEETVQKINSLLPSQDSVEDLELFVQSLFSNGLKSAIKTTNILKTMHQQMIFNSSLILKKLILECTGTLLKDSADAWRVRVLITPDEIEVRHVRREESTSPQMMKSLTPTLAMKTDGDYPSVSLENLVLTPDIPVALVPRGPSKPQQHFIVEWELRLYFSIKIDELKAVKLKVVNLTFPRHLRNLELSVFNHLQKYGLV